MQNEKKVYRDEIFEKLAISALMDMGMTEDEAERELEEFDPTCEF